MEQGKISGFASHFSGSCIDHSHRIIMPGFVDIHVHGWGRGSFGYKGNKESLKWMNHDLVKAGVTSYLPTSGMGIQIIVLQLADIKPPSYWILSPV
ncbi:N-acetylglucosamine-6-phosphate deacetylase [Serratia fonticola]|uniref:N-acetylglucosamine-6-phosphate deacetylase n=1 Tax=Serratia fonticola TaxID=47917 RepID=UPI0003AEA87C|nr:N-acetylglucosamine-6-phosphate deacetylase [Serratia fonticola]ERK07519.1 N-acetylglucosamine-6-phosphate deacetylase [Serratia fonticola AU-AP2C]MBP0997348.1 hypothetical protein [Serratia fonticola]MBP1002900.1 hypothetical protein [Serratia fonticola]MBP1012808.1 hypothetical protein [Serratia fonticola]MBP1018065.1 hypothetical protein [Serratia fonticola]